MFLRQPLHQVDFRSYGELASRPALFDLPDNEFRRADIVSRLAHIPAALRVDNNLDARIIVPRAIDVLRQEALVYRTVAFPQYHAGMPDLFLRQAAHFFMRVPYRHFVERNAHAISE